MASPLLGSAFFGNQLVSNVEGRFRTTGAAQVETVFAVDDQRWNALHAVLLREFLGLFDLALDSERVEGRQELVLVDTLSSNKVSHFVRFGQALALFLDRFEDGVVDLVLNTHGFQGQEQLAVGVPWATEHGGNATEGNVLGQLFSPWVDSRLERVAMRATVPEQLHHLDLAGYRNRNRIRQLNIGFTGFKRHIGSLCGHAEEAGSDESGAEDQITHALLLDK